jgi:hypothetical protein
MACCLALIYLLYPTAQSGVLLDIHGDTLAMPLLLFALDALDRRSWRQYVVWLALALSCKFYVAAPVAVLGLVVWWEGDRRAGMLTALAGLLYGAVAFGIIRPLFTTPETSTGHRNLSYVQFYFGQIQDLLASWDWRLANAVVIFGPALFLIWYGRRWLLPGLLIAAAALMSTVGGSAGYASHHYGLAVPFIIRAAIEGARVLREREGTRSRVRAHTARIGARRRRSWRGDVVLSLAIVLLFNLALVDTPLSPLFWIGIPGRGLDENRYGITARDHLKDRFLREEVPPTAPLAASLHLAPHLVDRPTLYLVRYEAGQGGRRLLQILPKVDYVLSDALFDMRQPFPFGGVQSLTSAEQVEIGQVLRDPGFGLVEAVDGLLLFERSAPASRILAQQAVVATEQAAPRQSIDDAVGFIDAQITPLDGRRFRATFRWTAGAGLGGRSLVAVSTLAGVSGARMVHLPTYALLPTTDWQQGQVIEETFEVELPGDLPAGRYQWQVGWYDLEHPYSSSTDAYSQVGATLPIAEITVAPE